MTTTRKNATLLLEDEEQVTLPRSLFDQVVAEARECAAALNKIERARDVRARLVLSDGPFYANGADCAEAWVRGNRDSILTTVAA